MTDDAHEQKITELARWAKDNPKEAAFIASEVINNRFQVVCGDKNIARDLRSDTKDIGVYKRADYRFKALEEDYHILSRVINMLLHDIHTQSHYRADNGDIIAENENR